MGAAAEKAAAEKAAEEKQVADRAEAERARLEEEKMANRGSRAEMAIDRHATLHAELSKAAAFMRESKDNLEQVSDDSAGYSNEIEVLRQESKIWKDEFQRLSKMKNDLQSQVRIKSNERFQLQGKGRGLR